MSWKKKLIETGLIRYQLLLFLISSMCEKLAFFQEYGYLVIKMNTTYHKQMTLGQFSCGSR